MEVKTYDFTKHVPEQEPDPSVTSALAEVKDAYVYLIGYLIGREFRSTMDEDERDRRLSLIKDLEQRPQCLTAEDGRLVYKLDRLYSYTLGLVVGLNKDTHIDERLSAIRSAINKVRLALL
jgi:hypothetical protein